MHVKMQLQLLTLAALLNCMVAFPQDFLLATDWRRHDIYVVDLNGQQNIPLNLSTAYPTGVAFNPITRDVYWSEYMQHGDPNPSSIKKVTIDDQGRTSGFASMPLMRDNVSTSAAKYMAVDYRTGNVWFAHYSPAAIKVADRNLVKSTTIISNTLTKPTGIAVHPKLRMIYFCDHQRLAIESAQMDGQNRKFIVQTENAPFGLTIDINSERLYWLDDTMSSVVTIDLNGNGLSTLVQGQYYFQSIVLDDMYLYYTDTLETTVKRMAKRGQQVSTSMGMFGIGHMYALTLHKRSTMLEVDAWCNSKNGGCPSDAICLPSPSGYSCGVNGNVIKVPSPPLNIQNIYRTSTRVTLVWTHPMFSVSSYLIRYLKVGRTNFQEVRVGGNVNTVNLMYLDPGSQYDVSIFGVNMNYVTSPTSAKISFTTESRRPRVRITSGPEDVSTKSNMDVLMHCELDDFPHDLHLVWTKEEPYNEIYSYMNGQGSLKDQSSKKYEVTTSGFKFYLQIHDVQWSDGATYSCEIKGNTGTRESANLVVFHDMEFRTPSLREGTSGKFYAAGYYGSPKSDKLSTQQMPFLQCFYKGDFLAGVTTTEPGMSGMANYVITRETTMTVNADHNKMNLTCRIGTYKPDFYVDFNTTLEVLYKVRNIQLVPMKDMYSYGESATCMAEGNPQVNYIWTNTKMGMTVRSQTLQLTGNMAKDSWRCRAYNVVDGTMQSVEMQHTVRIKDQFCLHGDACRALCANSASSTMTDMTNYCCVTFAPCDGCSGYGPNNCRKSMCSTPSNVYSNGLCEC